MPLSVRAVRIYRPELLGLLPNDVHEAGNERLSEEEKQFREPFCAQEDGGISSVPVVRFIPACCVAAYRALLEVATTYERGMVAELSGSVYVLEGINRFHMKDLRSDN